MSLELNKIWEKENNIFTKKGMVRAEFNFWVGLVMDKFYDGLAEKKFIGTKCSKCGKVFLPPRNRCGTCFAKAEEYVDLPGTGVLTNFTLSPYKVTERNTRKIKKDIIVGLVKVDGADNAMLTKIVNVSSDDVKVGMKVKVVWAKRIKGKAEDIEGFEPIGGA